MRVRGRWFGLSVLLAIGGLLSSAAGCGDLCAQTGVGCQGKGGAGGETVCPAEEVPPAEPPKAEDQFPEDGRHYLTKDPTATCGDVPNPADPMGKPIWEGSHLFASLAAPPEVPTPILSTFCAYLWNGPVAPADTLALSMLPGAPAPDTRTVEPEGAVQDWAQNAFMGALHLPPMDSPSTGLHVRVIVADTEAKTVPVDATELQLGSNMHGNLMGELIHDVACPPEPEPCSVEVETRLAMPLIRRDGLDTLVLNGGDFGRLGDLAAVIDDALVDWRTQLEAGTAPEMLVLNLSLGFEREDTAQETAADDAVKQALRAFACHGGAIFAAAGNHDGPDSHGLVYPGKWQTEPEPTPDDCRALLGPGFYEALDTMYKAQTGNPLRRTYDKGTAFLLSAVGAVDKGGRPITKTREAWPVDPSEHDSECPRLVAHGLGWSKGDAAFLLTGTSDAAAVVSAVFAKGMAQSTFHGLDTPYLTAHPQTLRDALIVESARADFDGNGPCGVPWFCGQTPWIAGLESVQGDAPANEAAQFPWQDYLPSGTSATLHSTTVHPCSQWRPVCERAMASPLATVLAQPGNIPCAGGGCVLQLPDNMNDIAIFYIDPAMAMTSAKLTIDRINGQRTILDLDPNVTLSSDADAEAPHFAISGGLIDPSDRVSFSAFNPGNQVAFADQVLLVKAQQQQ